MNRQKTKDFDWLEDPFNDKKAADEYMRTGASKNTKIALGCACIAMAIVLVVLLLVAGVGVLDILSYR